MNEKLMKVVERAVRPVRAGRTRKLQMRQELLAHLTALYDEERERLHDESAAFAAACERFGDPADLARELDESTSRYDRWAFAEERIAARLDEWLGFSSKRSLRANLLRNVAVLSVITLLALIVVGLMETWDPELRTVPQFFPTALALVLYSLGGAFLVNWTMLSFAYLLRSDPRPLDGKRIIALCAPWCGLFALYFVALWWFVTRDPSQVVFHLFDVALGALVLPPAMLLGAWAGEQESRRHREWSQLVLDE